MDFGGLTKCTDLRAAHIAAATASSDAMVRLLARFVEIAAPGRGAPIVLAAFARLGTSACDWIDGELRVELTGDDRATKIAASTSIGAGFREKLFADTVLQVPLEEFSRGIARTPRLIQPLKVKESGKRIVLTASQEIRRTSLPPPMVTIDPTSLMDISSGAAAAPRAPRDLSPEEALPVVDGRKKKSAAPAAAAPAPPAKIVLRRRSRSEKP